MNSQRIVARKIKTLAVLSGIVATGALVAAGGAAATAPPETTVAAGGDDNQVPECAEFDPASSIADLTAFAAIPETNTFGAALEASNVDDLLADRAPFTVFAPNNEAFDAIPESVFESLLNDPALLDNVVAQHLVVGRALSRDQLVEAQPKAFNGVDLAVRVGTGDGGVPLIVGPGTGEVGATAVCVANASDGTIYVIGSVLQPPPDSCVPAGPGPSVPGSSVAPSSIAPSGSTAGSSVPAAAC